MERCNGSRLAEMICNTFFVDLRRSILTFDMPSVVCKKAGESSIQSWLTAASRPRNENQEPRTTHQSPRSERPSAANGWADACSRSEPSMSPKNLYPLLIRQASSAARRNLWRVAGILARLGLAPPTSYTRFCPATGYQVSIPQGANSLR